MICADDFDWREPTVEEQPATAVYVNVSGAIVIRQQQGWGEGGDTIVIIQPEHAHTVAAAILAEVGIVLEGTETTPTVAGPSKDRTAAERQRKRRIKLRDSHAPEALTNAVTGRDVTPSLFGADE